MKFIASQLSYFFADRTAKRNIRALLRFVAVLVVLMLTYSILFHYVAAYEGQDHSWLSGLYWTVVTMTTLGYGDIVFESDLGRMFATTVLLSGVLFLLVLLPFAFIQFFYAPWIEAQQKSRAPRRLPDYVQNHVIITRYEPVTMSLIQRLVAYGYPYVLMVGDLQRALAFYDEGLKVVVAPADDPEGYRRVNVDKAALVVATGDDFQNSNIAFTVREVSEKIPIVATVRAPESVDVLELAGSSHVLQLAEMLGRSLARSTLGGETRANVIGGFDRLQIAEAPVAGTPLAGKTLVESRLREITGVTVVGIWERGQFELPQPDSEIHPSTVLLLAGSEAQLKRFDELICIYNAPDAPVLILGGGRVGRAAARTLEERGVDYRIVEKDSSRIQNPEKYVLGSAADLKVLEQAGLHDAPTAIVTTNDDATNIYLTVYVRQLRPNIQIISRATLERNVSTLYRAGADFVMSYATMGANAIFNILEKDDIVMVAEGLDVFRYPAPRGLVGRTLAESGIRQTTGCSVVGIEKGGDLLINPRPDVIIPADSELILIGTTDGERKFIETYRR